MNLAAQLEMLRDRGFDDEGNATATIKVVSRDHLLPQKAEAFVFRSGVKVRDAYDIRLLLNAGGMLSGELEKHLSDVLAMREIGSEELAARIDQVTARLCRAQLVGVLPAHEYRALERADFQPLRLALRELFQRWLQEGATWTGWRH